jgi:sporulation protein YlmC with PRC-barrel domain
MRKTLITIASTILLTAATASAQTGGYTGRPAGGAGPGATAPAPIPKAPAVDPLTLEDVSKLNGTAVYGSDDKKIGSITTVLMKPDSKTIDRLVVNAGGMLGVGGHPVAMPLDAFKWDGDKAGFKIAKSGDELKAMPEWKAPSTASGSTVPSTRAAPAGAGGSAPPR